MLLTQLADRHPRGARQLSVHCVVRIARCGAVFLAMLMAMIGSVLVKRLVAANRHASVVAVRVAVPFAVLVAMDAIVLVAMLALMLVAMVACVVMVVVVMAHSLPPPRSELRSVALGHGTWCAHSLTKHEL